MEAFSLQSIPRIDCFTLEVCIEALEDAIARFGKPEIFNTDQGSQLTSPRFIEVLTGAYI